MSYDTMSFEERHTAWVDGALTDAEREAFERELPDRAEAELGRDQWRTLSARLREAVPAAELRHPDFVNSQVLEAIRREEIAEDRKIESSPATVGGFFSVARLAWAGSFLVAVAAVLSAFFIVGQGEPAMSEQLVSRVIQTDARAPGAEAYVFQAPSGRGTVLWIEGAGYIPPTEKL